MQFKKFNQLCNLLLQGNGFESLNSNDFPKAYKYNNFPEEKDIDITLNLLKYDLNQDISKVILTKHCIKSQKNNEIHGINYLNLPKQRFFKFSTYCINNAMLQLLKRKKPINLFYDSFRIETEFQDLNTNLNFKLGFQTKAQTAYEIEIKLITIFYPQKHQINTERKIETSFGKKDSYITKKLFLENIDLKIISIKIDHLN